MFRLVVLTILVVAVSTASIPSQEAEILPLDGRIVGGTVTDISKHPHQISMRYKSCTTCTFYHRCGGSIITSKIILTAAHCVTNIAARNLVVVAGANVRNGGDGALVPVENTVIHEDYSKITAYDSDVAILVLLTDLPLNTYDIKPIELAENVPPHGAISTITGWGTTSEGGTPSDLLLEVQVPIVSNEVCNANYNSTERITDTMLCAGTAKGGTDACQGDSGGPLLVDGLLAGIVSWGSGCARPDIPGVYANVPNLKPWIDNVINSNT